MMGRDHDHIEVRGARENNLAGVDVDIPKRLLTVFTGVSGSGKSSLVFGTIAAESQRLINETYTAFIQGLLPAQGRPDVDSLANLSAAIIVDQERMGANSRSTMGTATDAYSMLRIIYSRLGDPHIGPSNLFSFNDPGGMCPDCEGVGKVSTVDVDAMVDRDRSLAEGAILLPNFGVGNWFWQMFADSGYFDVDAPLRDYTPEQWERFLHGPEAKIRRGSFNFTYEGLVDKFRRLYLSKDVETMRPHVRAVVERVATFAVCAGVRRHPAQRGGAGRQGPGAHHRRVRGDAGQRPGRLRGRHRRARRSPRCSPCCGARSTPSSRSASATSASTASRPRCRAARPSGSRWSATWGRASPTSPTCSTSRRWACTPTTSTA